MAGFPDDGLTDQVAPAWKEEEYNIVPNIVAKVPLTDKNIPMYDQTMRSAKFESDNCLYGLTQIYPWWWLLGPPVVIDDIQNIATLWGGDKSQANYNWQRKFSERPFANQSAEQLSRGIGCPHTTYSGPELANPAKGFFTENHKSGNWYLDTHRSNPEDFTPLYQRPAPQKPSDKDLKSQVDTPGAVADNAGFTATNSASTNQIADTPASNGANSASNPVTSTYPDILPPGNGVGSTDGTTINTAPLSTDGSSIGGTSVNPNSANANPSDVASATLSPPADSNQGVVADASPSTDAGATPFGFGKRSRQSARDFPIWGKQ